MNLKELKELCEKATPGPWYNVGDHGDGPRISKRPVYEASEWMENEIIGCSEWMRGEEEDWAFIAAANPQTILRLISVIEKQREALEWYASMNENELAHSYKASEALGECDKMLGGK